MTTDERTATGQVRKGGFAQGVPLPSSTAASAGQVCCGEVAVNSTPADQTGAGCCGEVTASGSGGCCGEPAVASGAVNTLAGSGSGCCN